MKNSKETLTIILGVIACIIFFVGGHSLRNTGKNMNMLKSQAGTSLAEGYYQEVGNMNKGLGILCYGFGIATLSVSIGLNSNNPKIENNKEQEE
jgi:hypothetical protein